MFQTLASADWAGLVLVILLWMFIVWLALWALDHLFPQIERSRDDRAEGVGIHQPGGVPCGRTSATQHHGGAHEASEPTARLQPPATAIPTQTLPANSPAWLQGYWQTTRQIIGTLLLIWLASFLVPIGLAYILHLTGLSDGSVAEYVLAAQGPLLIFVALMGFYVWRMRRLDQMYRRDPPPLSMAEWEHRSQLLHRLMSFLVFFLLGILGVGALEMLFDLPPRMINWTLLLLTTGVYSVVGWKSRARSLEDYYVAERTIPGLFNGLAIGSEWISGAAFVSLAGALWLLGYEGLAYIIGWAGGYVLLALLIAPYLRKSGQYTVSGFIGMRYKGMLARVISACICIGISFVYMTAQMIGIGIILSHFLGISYAMGVGLGLVAILLCSFRGGMRAITWTQVLQGIVIGVAYLIPITWLALRLTGSPLPQLAYREAINIVDILETARSITPRYSEPFNDWTFGNYVALVICLMLGTASMPHILVRFYTVPSVRESRSSAGWALLFITVIYLTVPAYAAFSRWEILEHVVGRRVTNVPEWVVDWSSTDWLKITDDPAQGGNGNGIVEFNEIVIDQDLVVLSTAQIAGLPGTIVSLVVVGGLAAALSTASGLLLVISSTAVHDVYYRSIYPRGALHERLWLVRGILLVVAVLAALTALARIGIIAELVAWTFSFTAAVFFPILVLGIFWKGTTSAGAVLGMLTGATVTATYLTLNYLNPDFQVLGITHNAAGIFGIPANFGIAWLISRLGRKPSARLQALVDVLRYP